MGSPSRQIYGIGTNCGPADSAVFGEQTHGPGVRRFGDQSFRAQRASASATAGNSDSVKATPVFGRNLERGSVTVNALQLQPVTADATGLIIRRSVRSRRLSVDRRACHCQQPADPQFIQSSPRFENPSPLQQITSPNLEMSNNKEAAPALSKYCVSDLLTAKQ